ncbi:SanA/YdcF family protein [Butyrivibrio sp. AE2032]|uniref:SanA/YdcF family protein n=1 Tax=Butyrivibrio sp. AE2032 TaxID=1458463 RepID=UPI00068CA7C9|nr:YdcF family protein [Butyrivibrio sp. AE2032]
MKSPKNQNNKTVKKTTGRKIFELFVVFALICLAVFLVMLCMNAHVKNSTKSDLYTWEEFEDPSVSGTTHYEAVIVLGCAVWGDYPSPMLADRLRTAALVYKTGCADYVLVSGDGKDPEKYDEIVPMRDFLISEGVPADAIKCDPLGLSTYDTMLRAEREFDISSAVVVTTGFHVARSVYDSRAFGIESVGVEAINTGYVIKPYNYCREFVARCKDIFYALIKPGY